MKKTKLRPENLKVKERKELERQFLGSVIAEIDFTDLRLITGNYPGVTWRHFQDKRHQALWRMFQTLDLSKGMEERIDILLAESGHAQDIADDWKAWKELVKRTQGEAWLEHELEFAAPGALRLVGGKQYLREISLACETGLAADGLARQLGFI